MSHSDGSDDRLQDGEVDEQVVDDPALRPRVGGPRDPSVDRAIIARLLIWMMAIGLLVHYVAVTVLELSGKHDSVKSIETILNGWLPILSGLVGSAVTYYFAREK
jgi:hypothetical protein